MLMPIMNVLLLNGTVAAVMVVAPVMIPELPTPEMARPTIRIAEDRAVAATKEPSSKITIITRNRILR